MLQQLHYALWVCTVSALVLVIVFGLWFPCMPCMLQQHPQLAMWTFVKHHWNGILKMRARLLKKKLMLLQCTAKKKKLQTNVARLHSIQAFWLPSASTSQQRIPKNCYFFKRKTLRHIHAT